MVNRKAVQVAIVIILIGLLVVGIGTAYNSVFPESGRIIRGTEVRSLSLQGGDLISTTLNSGGPEGITGLHWKLNYVMTDTVSDLVLNIKGEKDELKDATITSNMRFRFRYGPSDPWIHQSLTRFNTCFVNDPNVDDKCDGIIEYGRGVQAWKSFMQYTMDIEKDGELLNSFTRTYSGAESSTINQIDGMPATDFYNGLVFLEDNGFYSTGTNTPSVDLAVIDDGNGNFRIVLVNDFLLHLDNWNEQAVDLPNFFGLDEYYLSFADFNSASVPKKNFVTWKDVWFGTWQLQQCSPDLCNSPGVGQEVYTDRDGGRWLFRGDQILGIGGHVSSPLYDQHNIIVNNLGSEGTVEWDLNYIDIRIPKGTLGRASFTLWCSVELCESEITSPTVPVEEEIFVARPVITSAFFSPVEVLEGGQTTLLVTVRNDGDAQGNIIVTPIVSGFTFSPDTSGLVQMDQGEVRTFSFIATAEVTSFDISRGGVVEADCGDVDCTKDARFVTAIVKDTPRESCLCEARNEMVDCAFERNNPDVCEISDPKPSVTPPPTSSPVTEKCGDLIDNDSDGEVDEGCESKDRLLRTGSVIQLAGFAIMSIGFFVLIVAGVAS